MASLFSPPLKRLLSYVRPYFFRLAVGVVLVAFVALAEGLVAFMIGEVLSLGCVFGLFRRLRASGESFGGEPGTLVNQSIVAARGRLGGDLARAPGCGHRKY